MFGIRRTLSSGALAGVAAVALAVVASAPAAAGYGSSRSFQTGVSARGTPFRAVESLRATAAMHGARLAKIRSFSADRVGGKVRMVVETRNEALARASVLGAGGRIERAVPGLVQVVIAPNAVPQLAGRPGIERVREPYVRIEHAVSGEEVSATLSEAWHEKGFTGKGVKVAIIDGGFAGLADRQAAGDLPANAITQDFCGGNLTTADSHGTAVAEIVHEMAPDAQLYLVCIATDVDFAAAVAYAKSQGVNVINHSVGWEGAFRNDGTDPFSALVADARASGILWVNSAGNEADTHWSGTFNGGGDVVHDWSPSGDEGNTFVWPNNSEICGFLRWDEWPRATSDFDLALVQSGSNALIAFSAEDQSGSQPPFEGLCVGQSSGADLLVYWAIVGYRVTTSPPLDLVSWSPTLQYSVPAGSIAAPATSSAALAVGALCWQSRQLEFYSSQGPTIDGRVKPDLVGHDSVSGATYGAFEGCPSAFAGTSASSPEVAGAAALVKQAYPSFGPDQIKDLLMRSARDLGTTGLDSVYGAGELQLPKPPDVVAPTAHALVSSGRRGQMLELLSTVSDDSGEVSVVEQVKLGGRAVATVNRRGYVAARAARTVATEWKVPAKAAGAYQHCVRVTDRAGNASPISCAKLVLK
jgi:subtilisin family serine protease